MSIYIGLTGLMASGKGEVSEIFKSKGYKYISLSDIVREEAAKERGTVSRAEMQDIGNRLRDQGGPGVLGKMVRNKISSSDEEKWIIDGIRNPREVDELRELPGFRLCAVISDFTTIIERILKRKRPSDRAGEDELITRLNRERGIGEPEGGQRVDDCIKISDIKIHNNSSLENLRKKIEEFIESEEKQNV